MFLKTHCLIIIKLAKRTLSLSSYTCTKYKYVSFTNVAPWKEGGGGHNEFFVGIHTRFRNEFQNRWAIKYMYNTSLHLTVVPQRGSRLIAFQSALTINTLWNVCCHADLSPGSRFGSQFAIMVTSHNFDEWRMTCQG